MEDLKVTLKRLAHHTDATSTAAEWAAASTRRSRADTAASTSRRRYRDKSSDSDDASSTGSISSSSPPIARKLFSTPPPPTKLSAGKATSSSTKSTRVHLSRVAFSTPQGTKSLSTSMDLKGSTPLNGLSLDSALPAKHTTPPPTSSVFSTPTSSASSSAQGSRAVLSALKALQDKIRRLEDEREKLLQELSDVKVKARKREAEAASLEKKLTYELGQSKDAARAAYESMRSEKEELKLELVRFTEQRKALETELQHAERLAATQASKADDLRNQLQASTEQQRSLSNGRKKTLLESCAASCLSRCADPILCFFHFAELETLKATHKHELRELQTQVNALQSERDSANERIERLHSLLEQESTNHAETRERLRDSEQTVAAITQLNEKLVAKVWESQDAVNKITKKNKRLQQQQRTSTLTRPTASSLASSAAIAKSSSSAKGTGTRVAATASGGVKDKKTMSKKLPTSTANNLELLRAANLSSEIPFLLGTSPNRSFSIIGNVQEALRQCDSTYVTPDTLAMTTTMAKRTSSLKTKKKSKKTAIEPSAKAVTTSSSILGVSSSDLRCDETKSKTRAPSTLVAARTSRATEESASNRHRPPAICVPAPTTSYTNPMQSQIIEDLEAAVAVAETEFNSLNTKYRDMVAQVERGANGAAAQLSAAMGPTLDELEAKGKQLHRLKQVLAQASRSSINPIRRVVHSPEALARKTASLRILHDYRQLEREAQRPHSPTTRSPCRRSTQADTSFLVDDNHDAHRDSILS
ncbi:hypothetical protein PINS_up006270 [Pythium insidiosum]|nr:hypothetical protein PINS_up006270 [Pythium insidiosum]